VSDAKEVAEYAQRLHARGWVANHDGNVTIRHRMDRFLATPTATSKAAVRADGVLIVDERGAKVSGRGKPFSELGLHLTVYRKRADVNAVIHAHPPTATGFAVAGVALAEPMIAEAVVSLGVGVPTVPTAAPGEAACAALAPFVTAHDAVLLGGHGVLAWGVDLEQAFLRLELVEHLARVALVAHQLGGVHPLPAAMIPALLHARVQAGLAREKPPDAVNAVKTVVACAPAPPGSTVQVHERAPDLATIIRQEVAAALSKK
jgi:L-fuculose-phosphate aldolase